MFNSDSLICLFMLLLVKERVIEFGVFGNACCKMKKNHFSAGSG